MLTPDQQQTLKAAILADPALDARPNTENGAWEIAQLLNEPTTTPAVTVWRTAVPIDEIMRNGMDWSRVDNLTIGKARIWEWMSRLGTFDASRTNIRAGIDATWVGTSADLSVRAVVYSHCKRTATRGEAIFATGPGTDASPATMNYEGALSYQDVYAARNAA